MARPIKVGFDLDGVLLYNPVRIFRPVTMAIKSVLPKKNTSKVHFYYPKTIWEQMMWQVVHWSSLFIAPGFEEIKKLTKNKQIDAYIVTSRYDCLKEDFKRWLKFLNKENSFIDTFHNKENLQPHVFKAQKIKELALDYFIEDNWDIVQHINKNTPTKTLWISNALDKHIPYDLKFFTLEEAMDYIKTVTNSGKK